MTSLPNQINDKTSIDFLSRLLLRKLLTQCGYAQMFPLIVRCVSGENANELINSLRSCLFVHFCLLSCYLDLGAVTLCLQLLPGHQQTTLPDIEKSNSNSFKYAKKKKIPKKIKLI